MRSVLNRHDWIPSAGIAASKDNPYGFDTLGVEIMKSAGYTYTISGDQDHFVATATAQHLGDHDPIDKWQIDETGDLRVIMDASLSH